MKKIIVILCLICIVFPVIVNSDELTSKLNFCRSLSEVAEHTMLLRQTGMDISETKTFITSEMYNLGFGDYQESTDMVDIFLATAYAFPVLPLSAKSDFITFMGKTTMSNCIEDLVDEKDFTDDYFNDDFEDDYIKENDYIEDDQSI